jgi:hypothetical protein
MPSGSFNGTGVGRPVQITGDFNIELSGSPFTATVVLERSLNNGTTWVPVSKNVDGAVASYTAPISLIATEPRKKAATASEPNPLYRFNCTAYTSGPIGWFIGN